MITSTSTCPPCHWTRVCSPCWNARIAFTRICANYDKWSLSVRDLELCNQLMKGAETLWINVLYFHEDCPKNSAKSVALVKNGKQITGAIDKNDTLYIIPVHELIEFWRKWLIELKNNTEFDEICLKNSWKWAVFLTWWNNFGSENRPRGLLSRRLSIIRPRGAYFRGGLFTRKPGI